MELEETHGEEEIVFTSRNWYGGSRREKGATCPELKDMSWPSDMPCEEGNWQPKERRKPYADAPGQARGAVFQTRKAQLS